MNETRNTSHKEHIFSVDYAETLTLNLRLSTLSNLVARLHLVVKGKFCLNENQGYLWDLRTKL